MSNPKKSLGSCVRYGLAMCLLRILTEYPSMHWKCNDPSPPVTNRTFFDMVGRGFPFCVKSIFELQP